VGESNEQVNEHLALAIDLLQEHAGAITRVRFLPT